MPPEKAASPRLRAVLVYAAAFAIAWAVASLGAFATQASLTDWYPALAKPWFNPPNWAFPLAWTFLFAMIAISGARVALARHPGKLAAYVAYAAQYALNAAWSFGFFYFRSPLLGLVVLAAFWPAILATILAFRSIDRMAAWLLYPYLAWVSFAAVLNVAIWRLN